MNEKEKNRFKALFPTPEHGHEFVVGLSCMNDCIFCSEIGLHDNPSFAAIREVEVLEEKLAKLEKKTWVRFGGREPTTNPKLADFIHEAAKWPLSRILLNTNGLRLADEAYLVSLLDAGLTGIEFSIHAPVAEINDKLTAKAGSFEKAKRALENIAELRSEYDISFNVKTVVVQDNLAYLERMIHFLENYSPDAIVFLPLQLKGNARINAESLAVRYRALVEAVNAWDVSAIRTPVRFLPLPFCIGVSMSERFLGARNAIHTKTANLRNDEPEGGRMVKRAQCKTCAANALCPGVEDRYIHRFGWEEFEPISKARWEAVLAHAQRKREAKDKLFLTEEELLKLLHPLGDGAPHGGWFLQKITPGKEGASVHFAKENASQTIQLQFTSKNNPPFAAESERFGLCLASESMPNASMKFWETLIKVIQLNDKKLCMKQESEQKR